MMAQKSQLQEAEVSSRYLTFSLEPDLHDPPSFSVMFEQKSSDGPAGRWLELLLPKRCLAVIIGIAGEGILSLDAAV